jgi:hypothetical protein
MPNHDDEPSFDWADLPAAPDDQHRHLVECAVAVNGSGELHDLVEGVFAKRICGHNPSPIFRNLSFETPNIS